MIRRPPVEYRTTAWRAARRAIAVGVLLFLAAVPFWLADQGDRYPALFVVLPVAGLALSAVIVTRFVRQAPRSVSFDAEGLRVVPRRGDVVYLCWHQIMAAHHEVEDGRRWRIESGRRTVHFRDDGFTDAAWSAIRHRIVEECARRDIPYTIDLRTTEALNPTWSSF